MEIRVACRAARRERGREGGRTMAGGGRVCVREGMCVYVCGFNGREEPPLLPRPARVARMLGRTARGGAGGAESVQGLLAGT